MSRGGIVVYTIVDCHSTFHSVVVESENANYFNIFVALVVFDLSIGDVAQIVAFKHWRNNRIKKTCL